MILSHLCGAISSTEAVLWGGTDEDISLWPSSWCKFKKNILIESYFIKFTFLRKALSFQITFLCIAYALDSRQGSLECLEYGFFADRDWLRIQGLWMSWTACCYRTTCVKGRLTLLVCIVKCGYLYFFSSSSFFREPSHGLPLQLFNPAGLSKQLGSGLSCLHPGKRS